MTNLERTKFAIWMAVGWAALAGCPNSGDGSGSSDATGDSRIDRCEPAPGDGTATVSGRVLSQDPYTDGVTDRHRRWARATAVLTSASAIRDSDAGGGPAFESRCYFEKYGLCEDVPFATQPSVSGGTCSSFLVAPSVMVTAGHCTENLSCDEMRFVFDYGYYHRDAAPTDISPGDIYRCRELVEEEFEDDGPLDYAVLKLERPVEDREPLAIRRSGEIETDAPIVIIGYPSLLPVKINRDGVVRGVYGHRFSATNSVFGGNSGGPLIHGDTGKVEGILATAPLSEFVDPEDEDCRRPNYSSACLDDDSDERCWASEGVATSAWRDAVRAATPDAGGDDTGPDADTADAGLDTDSTDADAGRAGDAR